MNTHDWRTAIDTEGLPARMVRVGDQLVTGSGEDLAIDTVHEVGKPEPAAEPGCVVIRFDCVRHWPNDPSRVQNQGVFYWAGRDSIQQVRIIYTGEPGVSALI